MFRKVAKQGVTPMAHPDAMLKMGAKDALVKIRELSCGLPDTYAYYDIPSFKKTFPETVAGPYKRVLKQNRGSQGEGIWVCDVKEGQTGPVTGIDTASGHVAAHYSSVVVHRLCIPPEHSSMLFY